MLFYLLFSDLVKRQQPVDKMAFSFGAKPATTGGFGGFGAAPTPQPAAATGFGGFGAPAATTQSTGLFVI